MLRCARLVVGLALAAGGCTATPPPGGVSGEIVATAFAEIPAGAALAVAPAAAGDRDAAVRAALVDALVAEGWPVADEAGIEVFYAVALDPASLGIGYGGVGVGGVVGSSGTHDVGVSVDLPIFGLGPFLTGAERFVVEVALEDGGGDRLWLGRASGTARTDDAVAVARAVFPALVGRIGRSVDGDPVSAAAPSG